MEHDNELKLQAYLDGELPEAEAREVLKWLAHDQEAVLLQAELKNTRQALAGAERLIQLPESREFFWSKIERDISRVERTEPAQSKESFFAAWRRLLVPVSAAAVLGIVILSVLGPMSSSSMAENEVSSEDDTGFVYRDDTTGTTMVWLSYPAENEVANQEPATKL
jgi:anti-sigma factor RsiW